MLQKLKLVRETPHAITLGLYLDVERFTQVEHIASLQTLRSPVSKGCCKEELHAFIACKNTKFEFNEIPAHSFPDPYVPKQTHYLPFHAAHEC